MTGGTIHDLPVYDPTEREPFESPIANSAPGAVETIAPYIDDKGKIVPPRLATFLRMETPTATGGATLYAYRDGVYQPAEDHLAARIHDLTGDGWTRHMSGETIGNIRAGSKPLDEQPPVDRINLTNGIYNLKTHQLQAHTPSLRSPVQLPVAYQAEAECPAIQKYLVETLDDDVATLFVELIGYLLTPDNSHQRAFLLMGPGGTGKTTALQIAKAMLGPANVSHVALQQLEEHRFAPAQLYGRLANIHADLPSKALTGTSVFKSVTGGDPIMGERKGCEPFTFRPYSRFVFSANEAPPTHDGTEAYFDRWTILPFNRTFRGTEDQDRQLVARLTTSTELSGLLNLALAAIPDVRRNGFTIGQAVKDQHDRFRLDSDPVAAFLEERTVISFLQGRTSRGDLYTAYTNWAKESGRRALNAQRFTARVRERYAKSVTETVIHGTRYWDGIELTQETK